MKLKKFAKKEFVIANLAEGTQSHSRWSKHGVSLVTVLMFMLVATIAATATYKWITSEGHSSASRMMQREAYQSAMAGIENARSWMTYNANDFGALVTQYFQSGKKAILMTPELQSSLNNMGQLFNVWLTGVEVNSNGTYKVQILSAGEARGGAKHSEEAIFNVVGLYQVNVPKKKTTYSGTIDFDYNYFGGGTKNAGDFHTKSMLINGNQTKDGNPAYVEKNLVVTGNFKVSGSQIVVGENACIGGYFDANNGVAGSNFYIEGNAKNFIMVSKTYNGTTYNGVSGDVYVGGDIVSANGNQELGGSLYLGGTWHTNLSGYQAGVKKNMCFGPHAYLDLPDLSKVFYADSDVWIANAKAIKNEKSNYDKIHLGRGTGSDIYSPYVYSTSDYTKEGSQGGKYRNYKIAKKCVSGYGGLSCSDWHHYPSEKLSEAYQTDRFYLDSTIKMEYRTDGGQYKNYMWDDGLVHADYGGTTTYNPSYTWTTCTSEAGTSDYSGTIYFPTCTLHSWFKSSGTRHNQVIGTDPNIECGQTVKSNCSSMWVDSAGCDGTSHYVRDPIITGINSFEGFADSGCAKNIKTFNSSIVSSLNSCSSTATEQQLYNGYVVVKVTDAGKTDFSTALDGKFIIIFSNKPSMQQMPATTKGSYVFVYFKEGAGEILMGDTATHNYFLYSPKNIDKIQKDWTGSVYTAVGTPGSSPSCATVSDLIGVKNIESDSNMLKSLAGSAILCDNVSSASCGGVVSATSSSSAGGGGGSSSSVATTVDTYHIATAPQLGITLESQYESRTNAPAAANTASFAPSILVMPRVIYLPPNPVGKLEDYYSVINLNGASETKNPSKVNCEAPAGVSSLETSGKLYSGDALAAGIHTCTYASGNGTYANSGNVEFYVVVDGSASATTPSVKFSTPNAELVSGGAGSGVAVNLTVPEESHGQFSVDVSVSSLPSGWHLVTGANTALRSGNVYTVTVVPNATTQKAFDIYADDGADAGTVTFQLTSPCSGCTIGSPSVENVVMTGSALITRGSLAQYCAAYSTSCDNENKYATVANRPDCNTDVIWVAANCTGSSTQSPNNTWKCGTNETITLRPMNIPSGCELFIPSANNSVSAPQNNESYTLYASLKRAPHTLTIHRKGASSGDTKVKVFVSETNSFSDSPTFTCSDNECSYSVYSSQYVKLAYDLSAPDKFSYWYSTSANSPSTERLHTGSFILQPISSDNTVLAQFNAKDLHCFYEDFHDLNAFCSSDVPCIANCAAAASSSCEADVEATSRWQLAYNNSSNAPVISGGSIYNNGETSALVLSNKHAGKNGKMTAMLQTTVLKSTAPANLGINSGLVIRSEADASSYLIVNFLGYGDSYSGTLKARLCKSTGKGTGNSTSNCTLREFTPSLQITPTSMIKVEMDVNGESLTIRATVDGTEGETSFTLNGDYALNGEYVGMKLSDRYFTLYDIGWSSTSFLFEGETCWDVPAVYCSFKANYLGDQVPKDSNVTPWVGASSWFEENGCEFAYYYSGEDNKSSMSSNTGVYDHLLASSIYKFGAEGLHGQTNQTGETTHNDALVAVSSCLTTTSLVGKNSSCGYFQVGTINQCSMDYSILSSTANPVSGQASTNLTINAPNTIDGINLRESSLDFTISDLAANQTIKVFLEDKNGKLSLPGYITGNGNSTLNVNVMSDVALFDPQHVVAVVMNGTSNYTVSAIKASCPYVFGVSNCQATYNGSKWIVTSTINNPAGAGSNGCTVTSDDNSIDMTSNKDINCPVDGRFEIADGGFYTRLNENGNNQPKTVKFTISAKNKEEQAVTPCVATSEAYYPSQITCDNISIFKGQAFPPVKFDISNCPSGGCNYTVEYDGDNCTEGSGVVCSGSGTYDGTAQGTFKPNPAPSTSGMTAGTGSYKYVVRYLGQTANCPIEVKEPSPATATCSVTNGVVSGTITGAEWGESVTAVIGLSDLQGNVLGTYTVQAGNTETYEYDLKTMSLTPGHTYAVTLTLNGVGQTCTNPSYTPPLDGFTLECPTGYVYDTGKSLALTGCDGEPACGEWSITPSNDGVSLTTSTSAVTIANAVPGTTYTVSGERGTESSKLTRSCSITFREPFSVRCNSTNTQDTIGNQSAAAAGDQITITPYDVKGCYSGCSYDITTGGNSVYADPPPTNTYNDGSIVFTDDNGYKKTNYSLTITNGTEDKTCKFAVTYPGTCKEIKWTPTPNTTPSNTGGGSWTSKNAGGTWVAALDQNNSSTAVKSDCFDIDMSGYVCSGSYQVRMVDCKGETVDWNSSTLTLLSNNDETSGNNLPDPKSTIKIVAPKECTLSKLYFDGCVTHRPVISCADLSGSKVKGAAVVIKPTATKCDNSTKCSYTITGAGTNINHSTKNWTSGSNMEQLAVVNETGEKTYKLKVANEYDESEECEFRINYTEPTACETVTWNMTGDNSNSASPSPKYPWKSCATITTNRICLGQVEIKAPPACENKTGKWNGVDFQLQGNGPPTKNFTTNPAPSSVINLVIDDCDSIRSVYMTNCKETGTLQNNKMTEVDKLYEIPAGVCVSLDMNWNNGYWIPYGGVKLRCSGDHSIDETVTVDSRCLSDHVHCAISYSGDICAVSSALYCSVSQ